MEGKDGSQSTNHVNEYIYSCKILDFKLNYLNLGKIQMMTFTFDSDSKHSANVT